MRTIISSLAKQEAVSFSEAVSALGQEIQVARSFAEFNPDEHPRGGKGTAEGGEFVKKGGSGTPTAEKPTETKLEKAPAVEPSHLAPPECVQSVVDIAERMGGVKDRHSAGDLVEELAKRHGPAMLRVIDKMPLGVRPNVLVHPGDEAKGIPTVWLLGWSKDEGTDIHDHAGSQVGINVLRGEITETTYLCDNIREHSHDVRAGSTMTIPDPYIHEVFGVADAKNQKRDVTVHAYWPPLDKMTYFSKDQEGNLHYDGLWDEFGPEGPKLSPQEVSGLILRAKEGGFTYDVVHHDSPKTGFSVSPYPQYEKVLKPEQVNEQQIQQYIDRREEVFAKDKNAQLGAWLDPVSGKVMLDIVRVVDDEEEAKKIAHEAHQVGVYNLGKGQYIELNPEERKRFGKPAEAGASHFSEGDHGSRGREDAQGLGRQTPWRPSGKVRIKPP